MTVDELVHVLCETHTERIHVTDPVTGKREVREVSREGLLVTLAQLIVPGMERGKADRGKLATPSLPIAVDVLELAESIRSELVRDILRLGDRVRFAPLHQICLDWYRLWLASDPMPAEHPGWVKTLDGWRRAVMEVMDPTVTVAQTAECPICGDRRYVDADGVEMDILVLRYQLEDPMSSVELLCRACGRVAQGWYGARQALSLVNGKGTE